MFDYIMGFRNIYKTIFLLLFLVFCMVGILPASSTAKQVGDTTAVSNTKISDKAVAKADSATSLPAKTLISTDVDTTLLSWTGGGVDVPKANDDHIESYKTAGYYVLLFILLCAFLGIVGKVLKVYELTSDIQGKTKRINWNRIQSILFLVVLVASLFGTYWCFKEWGWVVLQPSASEHGIRIDNMFITTTIITVIVFVLTHILLFGFSFKYAGSNKKKAYFYPHNNTIEKIWTIIPAIVLTILVIYGFFTWRSITNVSEADQKKAVSIEVTGEQFKWSIRYAGADNKLGLKNYKLINPTNSLGIDFTKKESWDDKLGGEIYLPKGHPVRITIGSKDVLHSFYMPSFRVQINAVPGMPTYFQFTPVLTTKEMRAEKNDPKFDYVLLCNKICGAGHYNMQAKVTVVSEKEYQAWLAKQPLYYNDDVRKAMKSAVLQNTSSTNKLALKN